MSPDEAIFEHSALLFSRSVLVALANFRKVTICFEIPVRPHEYLGYCWTDFSEILYWLREWGGGVSL